MKKNITITISNKLARKLLSHWYAVAIKNYEAEELARLIENGGLAQHPSSLADNWTAGSVAQVIGDLNLGEPLVAFDYFATGEMASSVFVEVSPQLGNFISIWDLANVPPDERMSRIKEYENNPKWDWVHALIENERNAELLPPFSEIAAKWSTEEKIKYCRNSNSFVKSNKNKHK